jgi:hypothetical protein
MSTAGVLLGKPGIQYGVQDGRRNRADLVTLLLGVTKNHTIPNFRGLGE